MEHFYWLDQIQPGHRGWVGDKALYLALLKQRGYPVLPGGVVAASALRAFLETIQWSDPLFADLPNSSLHIDVDNFRQLQSIARQICNQVIATPIAEGWLSLLASRLQPWQVSTVILHPSVAIEGDPNLGVSRSVAGLLQAQVCRAEPEAIALGLRQVWSELFRAKSLVCWQRLGVPLQRVKLAVLIQPIDFAIASGVMQVDSTVVDVQSIWGLGQALTDGIVEADIYQADTETGLLRSQRVNSKRYAYEVGVIPTKSAIHGKALSLSSQECLKTYPIAAEHQRQSSLGDRQLQQLIQIARQLIQEWSHPLRLEWMVCKPPHQSTHPPVENTETALEPMLYLTEMLPCSVQIVVNSATEPKIVGSDLSLLEKNRPSLVGSMSVEAVDQGVLSGVGAVSGQALAQAWVVDETEQLETMPANAVLIASHIQPHWGTALRQVAAVVTEQGGMTSHGAILAREVGIPAVVGVVGVMHQIRSGEVVFVDGDRGCVYRMNTSAELSSLTDWSTSTSASIASAPQSEPFQAIATQLMVNLSQTQALSDIAAKAVDGVGLLRSELMLREILKEHPQQWQMRHSESELIEALSQPIQQVAQAFAPRPIFYRSLDLRSHEIAMSGQPTTVEANPTLGLHGTLSYQLDPTLFDIELAALSRVQQLGYDNLRLLLPFVRTVEEFEFCRDRVIRAGLTQNPQFQLWIMAEVPSVLFLLPEYVKAGVQGVSIGSNDLTQLMLAVDRDHAQMTAAFNQCHPAVLQAMQHLIQVAKQAGIPCSICGQAPVQHPELVEQLIAWGITTISVSPDAVESTYRAIAQAERNLLSEGVHQPQG